VFSFPYFSRVIRRVIFLQRLLLDFVFTMSVTRKTCLFFDIILDNSKEAFITNIVTSILNAVFSVLTCFGNAVVLRALQKARALHSPSSIMLCCLAFSDLLVGLVCQPLFVGYKMTQLLGKIDASCVVATLNDIAGYITSGASLLTLAAVSVDRLLSLILHLRYHAIVTVRRGLQSVFLLWVFAIISTMLKLWLHEDWIFVPVILGLITLSVITFSTLKIFQIARKHQRRIAQPSRSYSNNLPRREIEKVLKCRKSAVTIVYVYGLFLLCFLPMWVTIAVAGFANGYTRKLTIVYNYASTAVFINSFLNPIVYCWRIRKIRRAVKSILGLR